jgi:hypothetical protein
MHQNPERIEQFTADVAAMKLRDPATALDRLLTRLGVAGMAIGVAFAVASWFVSHGTRNPLQQRDAIVLGLLGVTVALVGGALWLKATLAGFLRYWMARLCYEQAAQSDRLAAAITGAPAAPTPDRGGPTATTTDDGALTGRAP